MLETSTAHPVFCWFFPVWLGLEFSLTFACFNYDKYFWREKNPAYLPRHPEFERLSANFEKRGPPL